MRLTAIRERLGRQAGFTMPAVMGAMLVVMLISVAAITAANGDLRLARGDQDDKQAYAAAEAGVNDYLGNLNTDTNYWAKCTNVDTKSPLNDKGVHTEWEDVPGSANSEYSIELIPAPGKSVCDPDDPVTSMIDEGNVRIRSTGRVKNSNQYRTVTATFRRAGFLDFLYYTDLENQDPAYIQRSVWGNGSQPTDASGNVVAGPDLATWGADKCQRHWWGTQAQSTTTGRQEMPTWRGQYKDSGGNWKGDAHWFDWNANYDDVTTAEFCGEIQFITGDEVNGPFHSNDDIYVSGTPSFGRDGKNDRVEVSGDGYRPTTAAPRFFPPPLHTRAAELQPPETNQSLESIADPGYLLTGQTRVLLKGTTMDITNNGTTTNKPLPPSGVLYVGNGACGTRYDPTSWDAEPAGCGDVKVSGTYSKSLTIAAKGDVIVTGDITVTTGNDSLLGLISDQFVRVWHPVDQTGYDYNSCATQSGFTSVKRIDAAILALQGSFTVDNYWCGGPLGTLTVNGAIAQLHRGVVGSGSNGYIKDYNYNEDLRYRSPPHFLDPLQASWRTLRQGEQSPPCVKYASACPAGPS